MLSGELDGSDRHHFFQRLRRHLSFVVSDCQDELANAAIGSTYTVAAFCCLRSQPESGRSRRAGSGRSCPDARTRLPREWVPETRRATQSGALAQITRRVCARSGESDQTAIEPCGRLGCRQAQQFTCRGPRESRCRACRRTPLVRDGISGNCVPKSG